MKTGQEGFTLTMLLATCAVILIVLAVALPSWKYVMQDDREKELLFRGYAIADAIQAYQLKNANAAPPTLDALVKGKFLRKVYTDPMTKDGKWRLIHSGEPLTPVATPSGAPPDSSIAAPKPLPGPSPTSEASGTIVGLVVGVASRSSHASLRIFNGHTHYNEWIFAVGQPRVVGTTPELTVAQLFGGGPARPSPISGSGPSSIFPSAGPGGPPNLVPGSLPPGSVPPSPTP